MHRYNPFSEDDIMNIDPLELEVAEYEDIVRLRRAQQLASQTDPKLTPTAIIQILRQEGLGVGSDKYKEWEQAGLLEDIQQKVKNLAKELYEQKCLSVQEIGEIIRSQGYPYHNQLIGVWVSQEGWECRPDAKPEPQRSELDLEAFTLLVSRLVGRPISIHDWSEISQVPLLEDLPDFTPHVLLSNLFGEDAISTILAQEAKEIRVIKLLAHISGVSMYAEDFLDLIKRPLIPDTRYTPLYLVSSFEAIPQSQLFESATNVLQGLERQEEFAETEEQEEQESEVEEAAEEEAEEAEGEAAEEAEEAEKEAEEEAETAAERLGSTQMPTQSWVVRDIINQVAAYHYLTFSDYIRCFSSYPTKEVMDLMLKVWRSAPTQSAIVRFKNYLIYSWAEVLETEILVYRKKGILLPAFLSVAVYAYIRNRGLDHITFSQLLREFCGGKYTENTQQEEFLRIIVSFGAKKGLYSFDEHAGIIFNLTENLSTAEELLPERPTVLMPLPPRNDVCICGSGRKYKKCCIRYLEADIF